MKSSKRMDVLELSTNDFVPLITCQRNPREYSASLSQIKKS